MSGSARTWPRRSRGEHERASLSLPGRRSRTDTPAPERLWTHRIILPELLSPDSLNDGAGPTRRISCRAERDKLHAGVRRCIYTAPPLRQDVLVARRGLRHYDEQGVPVVVLANGAPPHQPHRKHGTQLAYSINPRSPRARASDSAGSIRRLPITPTLPGGMHEDACPDLCPDSRSHNRVAFHATISRAPRESHRDGGVSDASTLGGKFGG